MFDIVSRIIFAANKKVDTRTQDLCFRAELRKIKNYRLVNPTFIIGVTSCENLFPRGCTTSENDMMFEISG